MSDRLRGKKYKGTLYGRKYGTDDPFYKLSNMTEITTSKEGDSNELPSTAKEDYGESIEVEAVPKGTKINLKSNTYNKYAMARALMGEAVDLQATPETFNGSLQLSVDGWLKLANKDIDAEQLALTDDSGTEIDKATYEINSTIGMIRFKELGAMVEGDTINYTGKTKGRAGYQIEANTLQSITMELYLDGADRITGKDGILEIPHAVFASDGDLNWFSDDWWETGFTGSLVKDEGKATMTFTEYSE